MKFEKTRDLIVQFMEVKNNSLKAYIESKNLAGLPEYFDERDKENILNYDNRKIAKIVGCMALLLSKNAITPSNPFILSDGCVFCMVEQCTSDCVYAKNHNGVCEDSDFSILDKAITNIGGDIQDVLFADFYILNSMLSDIVAMFKQERQ